MNVTREEFESWSADDALPILRRDGVIRVPWMLNRDQVDHLRFYFNRVGVYNAHVRAKATRPPTTLMAAQVEQSSPMLCASIDDVVNAPYLFEVAARFVELAGAYFGEYPWLYSMNAFWTQPAPGQPPYQDTHGWHRDGDDRKQLVLFTALTDILSPHDGAHMYQRGTHLIPDDQLGRDFRQPPADIVDIITLRAGAMFLADTRGLHQGIRPERNLRGLAWARFGVTREHISPENPFPLLPGPISYEQDKLAEYGAPVKLRPDRRSCMTSAVRRAVELVAV